MTLDLPRLLPEVVAIARAAGEEIMKIYAGGFQVRSKADDSPVTMADDLAEAVIVDRLAALKGDIPAACEESIARDGMTAWRDVPERFWLVDPLDGTREFVSHNGEFSVNIALIVARRPVLGVVHAPATGETWGGCAPATAMMWKGGTGPTPMRARRPPASGLVVLESRSHGDRAALDGYLSDYDVAERRMKGSALKFGVLAEGQADLYPRLGPTMEWDTAAGHAVLEAAGGRVETLAGGPLLYGKPGFRNPDFVARGRA